MESTTFIKEAKVLIDEIKVFSIVSLSIEDEQSQGASLQRRINSLFSGLFNPTLPSAYKLRDTALEAGFFVDPKCQQWLGTLEHIRG